MGLSLLALAGMFIFGGKKKEEKKRTESRVPESLRDKVFVVVSQHGKGLYRILARATPEGDENIVKKILAHNKAIEGPDATQEAGYKKVRI